MNYNQELFDNLILDSQVLFELKENDGLNDILLIPQLKETIEIAYIIYENNNSIQYFYDLNDNEQINIYQLYKNSYEKVAITAGQVT